MPGVPLTTAVAQQTHLARNLVGADDANRRHHRNCAQRYTNTGILLWVRTS